jgi:hypothetical protein
MDKRDLLRNVLNSMIDNNQEQASLDMHKYLTLKMKEVAGIAQPQAVETGVTHPNFNNVGVGDE